jgi:hypothetical protein
MITGCAGFRLTAKGKRLPKEAVRQNRPALTTGCAVASG